MIIETTSKKTKKKDLQEKPKIYALLGVPEYFLFDPTEDYLDPPLQGNRLIDGSYQPIPLEDDGSLISEQLAMKLLIESEELQFVDPLTGERLLTAEEARMKAEAETERLREEIRLLREQLDRK